MHLITEFKEFITHLELINEGGNAQARDPETGEVLDFAEKMDMTKLDRSEAVDDFVEFFKELNNEFKKRFDDYLWRDFSVITSGLAFNGSSEQFFDMSIPDDKFVSVKTRVGDVDVTVPHQKLQGVFDILRDWEGKNVTKQIKYVGNKMKKLGSKHQINGVFRYEQESTGILAKPQIDFEGSDYDENFKPSSFAKFSHSSSWEDMQLGFKGVNHKYLLMSIVGAMGERDDLTIITSKTRKPKAKWQRETPRMLAFSVDRGLRVRFAPVLDDNGDIKLDENGKKIYIEKGTSQDDYEKNIPEIFAMIFDKRPTGSDLKDFNSFRGLVRLMKKYMGKKQIQRSFERMIQKCFGSSSQELERNNPELDYKIKWRMLDFMMDEISSLRKYEDKILKLADKFYKTYKTT